jgi:nucleoside-diphosphate-sugar epimerase
MIALFIGGTGTISTAISRQLAAQGAELYLLNRGSRNAEFPGSIHFIKADINDEAQVAALIKDMTFDVVCDFIGFVPEQVERDYRLFKGKTKQYMYISSASAYNKMPANYVITEGTALANPYWEYSRNKIACEDFLMHMYRENGFPVTIIRPSHTYDERAVPLAVHGRNGSWQVVKRIMEGKPVIIHGDGSSLWTITCNEDFAKGFIGLMGNERAIGEAFQITTDVSISWTQIYQIIAKHLGVELHPYYVSSQYLMDVAPYDYTGELMGDKTHTVLFDNSKLKRAVPGFCATITPEKGIARTLDYVLSHKECQKEDPEFDAWCDRVIAVLEQSKQQLK